MMRKGALLTGLLLAVRLSVGFAQEPASVRAAVDVGVAYVGDRVTLTVRVEHDMEQTVTWPAVLDTLGPFEVLGAVMDEPTTVDERATSSFSWTLTAFELGELEIPAIEVIVSGPGEAAPQVLSTDPLSVVIQSVGIDESGDIRGVKPPLGISRNWLLLLPWLLAIAAAGALSYWLFRRYRGSKRGVAGRIVPRTAARPPHEVAYEALDALEAKQLVERGAIKQYYIEVSAIVRLYLEGRYGIDALEMTSFEVLRELERQVEHRVLNLFVPFFERSDLVKFAKHRPTPEKCVEMIPMARRLVDETRERESAPDSEGGEASADAEQRAVAVS